MECQVCSDRRIPLAVNASISGALCRRSCPARICVLCLARHVQTSLNSFYAGILPLIRCPVCLLPMQMERWAVPLRENASTASQSVTLVQHYEWLCRQACAFSPACCDREDYTHLPDFDPGFERFENSLSLPKPKVIAFKQFVARFCAHRMDSRDVVNFSIDAFGVDDTREIVERTLRHISDCERRARLLLSYLYVFPNIYTRCCHFAMCFNCKRAGHHYVCEDFFIPVDEAQCLLRCRNCHVMLMKVEGCDAVTCVCGFAMSWSEELELRAARNARRGEAARAHPGQGSKRRTADEARPRRDRHRPDRLDLYTPWRQAQRHR